MSFSLQEVVTGTDRCQRTQKVCLVAKSEEDKEAWLEVVEEEVRRSEEMVDHHRRPTMSVGTATPAPQLVRMCQRGTRRMDSGDDRYQERNLIIIGNVFSPFILCVL